MARPSATSATVMQMVKTREDHPGDVAVEAGERHQVDVDGVQHQLDAEQDADGVAAREHAEEADGEDDGGEVEVAPGAPCALTRSGRAK